MGTRRISIGTICVVLIMGSGVAGWLVPSFYDWTGADQSRPSPRVGQAAMGLLATAVIFCGALPWLPIGDDANELTELRRRSFRLRSVFLLTAGAAMLFAALLKVPLWAGGVLCGGALAFTFQFLVRASGARWQTAALLGCLYLPFLWLFADQHLNVRPTLLWMAVGLPGLLPSMWVRSLLGPYARDADWVALLFTAAELSLGVAMIRWGVKRSIAYLAFALLLSLYSSFVLNAITRI